MSAGEKKKPPSCENRKARYNYEILETLEAGIELTGTEVKSLRSGGGDIADAYATPRGNELYLLNMRIEPYRFGNVFNHDERRTRRLLLHKKEIYQLEGKIREKRLTVVPLKLYFNDRGRVKVLLGVGRGKKSYDKRESEKNEQAKKEIARALKEANR